MTTRHRIRHNALAEEKKLRVELEQQPISFDLACALRDFIESLPVRNDDRHASATPTGERRRHDANVAINTFGTADKPTRTR